MMDAENEGRTHPWRRSRYYYPLKRLCPEKLLENDRAADNAAIVARRRCRSECTLRRMCPDSGHDDRWAVRVPAKNACATLLYRYSKYTVTFLFSRLSAAKKKATVEAFGMNAGAPRSPRPCARSTCGCATHGSMAAASVGYFCEREGKAQ